MDVVYVCRNGDNEELRYSLRSLKNIDHGAVWIFGGRPAWVQNVKFVPIDLSGATKGSKHNNTTMLLAAAIDTVPNDFILMNDDFYIVDKIGSVDLFDRGPVSEVISDYQARYPGKNPRYLDGMVKTYDYLRRRGFANPLSYELHAPMPIVKDVMRETIGILADVGCAAPHKRTIYGNLLNQSSTTIADVKVTALNFNSKHIPDTPFLSTADSSLKLILPMLKYFFRGPCLYEDGERACK